MGRPSRFSPEVRERAVRMLFDHKSEYDSQWAAIRMVAVKIGCSSETLRNWVLCRLRHKTHYADLRIMPTGGPGIVVDTGLTGVLGLPGSA